MTAFQRMSRKLPPCDICGGPMCRFHSERKESDFAFCANPNCGAEIVFPTSTPQSEQPTEESKK